MDEKTKIFHNCLSSHKEVMFRDREDLTRGFNCLAEAAAATDSHLLVDANMTTHIHNCVQTRNPKDFLFEFRNGYSRYFNSKYGRRGRLGERNFFILEVMGIRHIQTCFSYVLRQGLHHGISATAFGYEHCSIREYFKKDLGQEKEVEQISDHARYKYLRRGSAVPKEWRMDKNGMLFREDVLDTGFVEQAYGTARNFLFQMSRLSDAGWIAEQKEEDPAAKVITLELLESTTPDFDLQMLERNEKSRFNYQAMDDLELCGLIDNIYVPRLLASCDNPSVYLLSQAQRTYLAEKLWEKYSIKSNRQQKTVTPAQIRRCLLF